MSPIVAIERGRHPLLGERAVPQSLAARRNDPPARHQRPEHGRQDRRAEDGRTLRRHGLLRTAGTRAPRHAHRTLRARSSPTSATSSRSLPTPRHSPRICERMREMLDARGRTYARARRRNRRRHRTERGRRARRRDAGAAARSAARAASSRRTRSSSNSSRTRTPGVANASVRFDPQTFAPTFELDVGTPGQSLAFPLAARLGIDSANRRARRKRCSNAASAITKRRWPSLRCATASCARRASALEARAGESARDARAACGASATSSTPSAAGSARAPRSGCSRACATSFASCSDARRARRPNAERSAARADDRGDASAISASGEPAPRADRRRFRSRRAIAFASSR